MTRNQPTYVDDEGIIRNASGRMVGYVAPREFERMKAAAPLLPDAERRNQAQLRMLLDTRACDLWERVHPDDPNPMLEAS